MLDALVIADDLTGACDAAVAFRRRGMETIVAVGSGIVERTGGKVLGLSTDSRDLGPAEAEARVRSSATQFTERPRVLFKKIDSLLRGNAGWEIRAALDAFGCEVAILTPAFPEMHRIVRNGLLYLEGVPDWRPIDVQAHLKSQGLEHLVHVQCEAVQDAIRRGSRYISVETTCNQDLEVITRSALESGKRILWAGSAGLAAAVAAGLDQAGCGVAAGRERPSASGRPVLFCIGTNHSITAIQVLELLQRRPCRRCDQGKIAPQVREHVILTISPDASPQQLREDLARIPDTFGAVLLSGGRTAALICQALGIKAIKLEGEIVSGFPWGFLEGGTWENFPVATKSGAFGETDALVRVADFFSCPQN